MMKNKLSILLLAFMAFITAGFVSCSDDDLGKTIFDTTDYPLDRTAYTFPLDTFIKKNFLEPYNLKFIYRMEDIGSDLQKNLVPANYEKSVELAVLSKYLWYDVYQKIAGDEFIKANSPRIIHVIGSPSYNPTDGTETLGTAEGGLKITLYKVNMLNVNNLDFMNEYFFKTMHHEFGHILDQTHERPNAFNVISTGQYNADWANSSDSLVAGQGFVSTYASYMAREDWVEVMANYIVKDQTTWDNLLNTASYDWEEIDIDDESEYTKLLKPGCNLDTIGYMRTMPNGELKVDRKVVARNADGYAALDDEGNIQYLDIDGYSGRSVILQKLEMVREWLKTNWDIDIDELRSEVQHRQYATNPDGTFIIDRYGRFTNRLTAPSDTDPSRTLMDTLLDWVNQYKELQK